jgi:transcriptional regulator with PAS, ATPase and Fis domain
MAGKSMAEKSNAAEHPSRIVHLLLDAIPDPTYIVDRQGVIVFFNRAYEELLGIRRENVLGRHVLEIQPNSRIPAVLESGRPELGELMTIKGVDAVVQRIPLLNRGVVVGAAARVIFKNMTELKQLMEKVGRLQVKVECYERELREIWSPRFQLGDIIGESEPLKRARWLAAKIAKSESNALILGESGVGKEMFAHALHAESPRRSHPFICVNCAAIPKDLVEAELFGYDAGAFTGAQRAGKPGKFELADKGSIFLDEIGDMPLLIQSKILRVLESREVERVGGTKPVRVDVRVIAATNRNLESMVMDGLFRQDLYYRLHVVAIEVPPLRECAADIPLLIEHFIQKLHRERGLPRKEVDEAATVLLQSYHWPGNTRELSNLLEHLMNTVDGAVIGAGDLPPQFTGYKVRPNTSLTENLGGLEKELVSQAMGRARGNKKRAARLLGIHRSTLYDKLKKLGMADQE